MVAKWDKRFLQLAKHISSWSKDPSTGVGAVLVNKHNHVVGIGYNGFAAGVADHPERYADRELKLKLVVHAEVNAILQAGERSRGCALYVYPSFALPNICHDCAKFAIQAGVVEVVGYEPKDDSRAARWKDSIAMSAEMFREAGVAWYAIKEE